MPRFGSALAAATALLIAGAVPAVAATTHAAPTKAAQARAAAAGTPVALANNAGTQTDVIARKLAAEDLESARSRGDKPLVLTGRGLIGAAQPALFVQLQSEQECGSAGCTTSVYAFENGKWKRVLDSATGKLTIAAKKTRGRNDILSADDHYVWNGTNYASLVPAPAVNLLPRPHPKRH